MAYNKIIIGDNREMDAKEPGTQLRTTTINRPAPVLNLRQMPSQEKISDEIKTNYQIIYNTIDETILADRRMYVRVQYMQRIKCTSILDNMVSAPVVTANPINFIIVDISMGGIGIFCDNELPLGTILVFNLKLDDIIYEVKYEVVYCFKQGGRFRAGLKIVVKDKPFIKHLKMLVARLSLEGVYAM